MDKFMRKVACALAISISAVVGVGAGLYKTVQSKAQASTLPDQSQDRLQTRIPGPIPREDEKLESVVLTLSPEGFDPKEITLPAGKTLMIIKKLLGPRNVSVALRVDGNEKPLHQYKLLEDIQRWAEIVELQPGSYSLSDVTNPDVVCRITITR